MLAPARPRWPRYRTRPRCPRARRMFDELFLMSFRSSNGSGMGATGATSGMSNNLADRFRPAAGGRQLRAPCCRGTKQDAPATVITESGRRKSEPGWNVLRNSETISSNREGQLG